jgi:hypothetical protein
VIAPVSARLGFDRDLTLADIEALFVTCVFGQAWSPNKGVPICQVRLSRGNVARFSKLCSGTGKS